jgi:hypothetical protein
MNVCFMKRSFMFMFFTFVMMFFSCSAVDAVYNGNVDDVISDSECLTFTASGSSSVSFNWKSADAVQYMRSSDDSWQTYTQDSPLISLNDGESVKFRGTNVITDSSSHFSMTGSISASGNVDSLRMKSLDSTDTENYGKFQGLTNKCYASMFVGCISLTSAPALPATTLANYCYNLMFKECKNLTSAPALPATRLDSCCYESMFQGCTNLTEAPALPGTKLYDYCYKNMFNGCINLTSAPALPATSITKGCYWGMFNGCKSLNNAPPELPATKLIARCYQSMFQGCSSLTNAPILSADTLDENCYSSMFSGCTALDLSATKESNYTYPWRFKVSDDTYDFRSTMFPRTLTPDTNGYVTLYSKYPLNAPSHLNVDDVISDAECLTFAANENDSSVTFKWASADAVEYKKNDGNWETYTANTPISLNDGDVVKFRGTNVKTNESNHFSMTGSISASGCLDSLRLKSLDSNNADYEKFQGLDDNCYEGIFNGCQSLTSAPALAANTLAKGCYKNMFNGCTGLTSTSALSATTLANNCYEGMFSGCTGLINEPELPAMTLANECYREMFNGCTGLTSTPELPATTLAENCYYYMFRDCTGLTAASELNSTTLATGCYRGMFNGCTSLTNAPDLPATTLAEDCYRAMFQTTGVTTTPDLPATELANNCYKYMFYGCDSLTNSSELPATTLFSNCYENMFNGCTSLTEAPELPATTLANNCYDNMFGGCTSLTEAPELPATNLTDSCYVDMFNGCTSLTSAPELPATDLANNCYASMFAGCTSLTSMPELPATDLVDNCYGNMFAGCTALDFSSAPEGDYKYPLTFRVDGNNMFSTDIIPDEDGYFTVYSKYPVSASLSTIIANGGILTSNTNKAVVKDDKLSKAVISAKIDDIDRAISSSSGKQAYITLKSGNNSTASSKKFEVTVSDGKIVINNIDLYADDSGNGAAPDDAEKRKIKPGIYTSYMTFVA